MRFLKLVSAMIAFVCLLLPLHTPRGASAAPNGPSSVYLPFVSNGSRAATPQPTPQPPASTSGALFLEPGKRIDNPAMATDQQGGMHAAYHYTMSEQEGGTSMVYAYCPPPAQQCANRAAWASVVIPIPVYDVQLQVTPAGKPRILAAHSSVGKYGGLFLIYVYAECDQNCMDVDSWRTGIITTARTGDILEPREHPRRSFALDRQGNPRFVFMDYGSSQPDGSSRTGGFLYSCDTDCAQADNWTGAMFTQPDPDVSYRTEAVGSPVLKFTSANQPRILGDYYPASSGTDYVVPVVYFACDSGCDDANNWGRMELTARGNGPEPAWDLELDAQDRPRAVVYHEETNDATSQRLAYYQCDAQCLDASGWQELNFGFDQAIGRGADLALDAAGHPRIAYLQNRTSLLYAWCNGGCDQKASWKTSVADPVEQLEATDAIAIPPSCVAGGWSNYAPSFVLDPQGNPRVIYNAVYYADCLNLPRPGLPPTSGFQEIAHRARVFFAAQP